jgi:transposase-like protein
LSKKTARVYVWLAVDRDRNKVVDIEVSRSRDFYAYYELAQRLEKSMKSAYCVQMDMKLIRNIRSQKGML